MDRSAQLSRLHACGLIAIVGCWLLLGATGCQKSNSAGPGSATSASESEKAGGDAEKESTAESEAAVNPPRPGSFVAEEDLGSLPPDEPPVDATSPAKPE